ncbi:ammonium transporter [Erythrobacter sp. SCSIO 43205]|uniref:ammonium transporter n=1 Tax=Erythrobacter sp. SCSIO 43205 TaxID=2779361 RepID=UPI001CA85690|nr:ammonium transporter [Erythrobacter sp. SCSIO 43205]UAB76827.1 ammonium transporter [Erythrobacter sp. SCSIO 43205]
MAANTQLAELAEQVAQQQRTADFVWTVLAATLVLMMQVGFLLLEAGASRSKNSISVAQKNLADLFLAFLTFYFIGFGLMFDGGGWFMGELGWGARLETDWSMAFFVFQVVFAGTAITIVSGAVAERMRFSAYLISAAIIAAFVYPVFGHWAWGNLLDPDAPAWLADMGFIDFAGSTVVHSMGGWLALAAVVCLGARRGRFDSDGRPTPMYGHSPILFGAGSIILFFGWIGFNGGSTTAASPEFAGIVLNTVLAGAAGGAAGMFAGYALERKWVVGRSANGMLAGLVGITAGCAAVGPDGALMIGAICGVAVLASEEFILRVLKQDDVVGAVSVHGVCGAIGTLLVAAFALPENLMTQTRLEQFVVQSYGVGAAAAWALGLGFAIFGALRMAGVLRVSEQHEIEGLNASEHGATLGTGLLLQELHQSVVANKDLTHRLDENSGDEAAEIATVLNPFLATLQETVRVLDSQASVVSEQSKSLRRMARTTLDGAEVMDKSVATIAQHSSALGKATQEAAGTNQIMHQEVADVAASARDLRSVIAQAEKTIGELGASIANAAQASDETAQVSVEAEEIAGVAGDLMAELESATGRIGKMIGFIDEVAFQTNMLSINASIEAAHAGAAGDGFAVVAAEIRALANQTKSAADEVRGFIEEITGGADNVRGSIDSIRETVATMRGKMAAIAQEAASHEMSAQQSQQALNHAGRQADSLEAATARVTSRIEEIASFSENVAQTAQVAGNQASSLSARAKGGLEEAESLTDIANDLNEQSDQLKRAAGEYRA